MNNKKALKRLQDVQAKIRSCYSVLEKSEPPVPASLNTQIELRKLLSYLFYGYAPSVEHFVHYKSNGSNDESIDYVNQLGHYLVNVAFYYKEKKRYEAELRELKREEIKLKEKLGIE